MDNSGQFRIVTIKNPSTTDFTFTYNKTLSRTIPAGKAMAMPYDPLGILAIKHLTTQLCREHKQNYGDPARRAYWESQIIVDDGADQTTQIVSPEQALQRKLDVLNNANVSSEVQVCQEPGCGTKTFNLPEHNALNHNNDEVAQPTPPQPPLTPHQKMGQDVLKNAVGGQTPTVLEEQVIEDAPAQPAPVETPTEVSREELIAYAKNTLQMDIEDPSTRKVLDTLPLDQLKKELNYGI